jgi:hypothetical protein
MVKTMKFPPSQFPPVRGTPTWAIIALGDAIVGLQGNFKLAKWRQVLAEEMIRQ